MMLGREQEKKVLLGLVAALAILVVYRMFTADQPKIVPLTYKQGAVATSPVRQGLAARAAGTDPLGVFLARREDRYPGVSRDIFRMENPAPKTKPTPTVAPVVIAAPTSTVPTVPVKTPEEIAAEAAREDLSKFRFLGYLTEKDNTLFLSKEGELFMVKSGDRLLKSYRVKGATKDHVILVDTATQVEVRVELSGGEQAPAQQPLRYR